jgi:hypothetical protein
VGVLLADLAFVLDIVHVFFCDVSADGKIIDQQRSNIDRTALIHDCGFTDVKLLWIASDNKPESYVRGFHLKGTSGKGLNLVMTIERKGPKFAKFLEQLLCKMSAGETMASAWASVASQNPRDPRNQNAPSRIFAAGRGGVSFR